MRYISLDRAKQILKGYNGEDETIKDGHALFNWCEEYKDFINDCVGGCVSQIVEYCLKKSYEDRESPLSYEDIDFFDVDKARENALYKFETNAEEMTEYANDEDTFNRRVKNASDFEVFLNSLNKDELKDLCDKFEIEDNDAEIFEYWVISEPLLYRLEQQGEIIIDGNIWGRQTTGQSISLDNCCIKAFISLLEDRTR